jgi:transcriptional regulator with XRE-family HTH domain
MSDHHERFPVWLRAELHRHGLNQTEFARAVGTSTSVVSRWVNAQAIPESESVDKIADVLNADLTTVMRLAGHLPAADPIDPDDPVERICGMVRRLKPSEAQVETLEVLLATWLRQKRDARKGQGRVPDSDAGFDTNFGSARCDRKRRRGDRFPGAAAPSVPIIIPLIDRPGRQHCSPLIPAFSGK